MWRCTEYTYRTRLTIYPDEGEDGPHRALDHMLKSPCGPVRRVADALIAADAPDAPEQRGDGVTVSVSATDWDTVESWLENHADFVRVR